MKSLVAFGMSLLLSLGVWAQSNTISLNENLQWKPNIELNNQQVLTFGTASYSLDHPTLPMVIQSFPLSNYGTLNVEIVDVVYAPLQKNAHPDDQFLSNELQIETNVHIGRRQAIGEVSFIPIRKTTSGYEKVVSYDLKVTVRPEAMPLGKNKRTGSNSVLADGEIYRIAVSNTGIHQLTYDFLKNDIGIDVDNLDPRNIHIYGNGAGMLPESNAVARIDDLEENAIQIVGEGDGSFDQGDYILFYAEAAHHWEYAEANNRMVHRTHLYDDKNHYFIKIASNNGKRIANTASLTGSTYSTSTFTAVAHHEMNDLNLLDKYVYASASGKEWYGETFKFTTTRDFQFNMPNLVTSEPVEIVARTASRSINTLASFDVFADGQNIGLIGMLGVSGDSESWYARTKGFNTTFLPSSPNPTITLQYNKPTSDAEGWLDYIMLNGRATLNYTNGQYIFRDLKSIGEAVSEFNISASNTGVTIWDVTNPTSASNQQFNAAGNILSFGANTSDTTLPKTYIVFDNSGFFTAEIVDTVQNQNLHGGLPAPDFVIIYHEKFEDEAKRLANHRSNFSNMSVSAVEIQQVYNEFSSGNADVSAIRDFAKYLYEEFPNFKYLLLFGDGSFDYKNINGSGTNHNYIPVYETAISTHPIRAFTSDDYYALLDPNEGNISAGGLDIGVGRIPARDIDEAKAVVDKIIRYDTNPDLLGDWKNRLTFVADDEDGNLHLNDGDEIAEATQALNPYLNLDKIYLDAYPQVSTHGGNRIPAVTDALHTNMFKGNFVVNYMGHGGEEGWAQERVLQIPHIQSWKNEFKLPLFVTATCSFAPYDDPSINSAGEIILLKPDGGSIALFTTTRAVYTSSNRKLTRAVFDNLFKPVNGTIPTMGEILRYAKNVSGAGIDNSRKFAMLGDPSQRLAYPEYKVITTKINGNPVSNADTISALQQVTIEGYVAGADSSMLSDFNGIIYPTVFDKRLTYQTLGQDAFSSVVNYTMQKTVLFKGRASVTNGQFQFSFVIPKDINYVLGNGKISYYADDNNSADATGFYDGVVIGGTNANAVTDDQGPIVKVYMNTEEFVFGGITDDSPTLLVKLEDDNGINTSGTGIGHDLTGVLDDNTQSTYVLNDFYESELDNFKKGEVRYPLSNLEEGLHQISVKAWDIANNSGEGNTEFVVASSAGIALEHVLNYPNPFTTKTEFQFEHNLPNQPLTVQVQIFSVSGRLVKTIQQEIQPDGYRVTGIEWDGTDDFGNSIGRGVYVYKVSVGVANGEGEMASESAFEKLVILK